MTLGCVRDHNAPRRLAIGRRCPEGGGRSEGEGRRGACRESGRRGCGRVVWGGTRVRPGGWAWTPRPAAAAGDGEPRPRRGLTPPSPSVYSFS